MYKQINLLAFYIVFFAGFAAAQQTVTTSGGNTNSVAKFSGSGTIISSAITESNGITSVNNVDGSAGFQFYPGAQLIGGTFGAGGNLTIQANSALDTTGTGGYIFLGGSQRGDFGVSKIWMTGNVAPGASPTVVGLEINAANNIGIGLSPATDPGARLEVNGSVKLTSGSGASLTFADGTVQSTAWTGSLCGGDYAESVDITGDRTNYEPGDALVVDPNHPGQFLKSAEPYSTLVAGIYSTKPGFTGRRQTTDPKTSTTEVPMAMVGIVPTKVSAENGPIKPGDLLVTSSRLGFVMKGTDRAQLTGAIVGKSLGNLDSGIGVIEVLVSLQ